MGKDLRDTSWAKVGLAIIGRPMGRQLKVLAEQLAGLCKGDENECVHHSRVASRKLRVALTMLGSSGEVRRLARWKNHLRRITRELGEARDHDVMIERLLGFLAGGMEKPATFGVALLLAEIEAERCRLQSRILSAARNYERSGVHAEMTRSVKRALAGKKSLDLPDLEHFQKRVEKRLAKQCRRLVADAVFLDDPSGKDRYHEMRISAKRLRYSLEMARGFFPVDLEAPIQATKKAQSLLGEVHDCDVWLARLEEFSSQESVRETAGHTAPGRTARLSAGIDFLKRQFEASRNQAVSDFVASWKEWQANHLWLNMLAALAGASIGPVAEENRAASDS